MSRKINLITPAKTRHENAHRLLIPACCALLVVGASTVHAGPGPSIGYAIAQQHQQNHQPSQHEQEQSTQQLRQTFQSQQQIQLRQHIETQREQQRRLDRQQEQIERLVEHLLENQLTLEHLQRQQRFTDPPVARLHRERDLHHERRLRHNSHNDALTRHRLRHGRANHRATAHGHDHGHGHVHDPYHHESLLSHEQREYVIGYERGRAAGAFYGYRDGVNGVDYRHLMRQRPDRGNRYFQSGFRQGYQAAYRQAYLEAQAHNEGHQSNRTPRRQSY